MSKEVEYGDNGKPTKAFMKWAFDNDRDLFLNLQEKHFTTGGAMNETPFDGMLKKMFKKKKKD